MKNLIVVCGLSLLVGACSLNDDAKKIPGTHGPPYHLHAYIWNSDSLKSEPLEAMVTMHSLGITDIESWDVLKKTNPRAFKAIKVHWDAVGAGGRFKMFDNNYTIQVIDDNDDHYRSLNDFTPLDTSWKKK